jgi:hypothetical protein
MLGERQMKQRTTTSSISAVSAVAEQVHENPKPNDDRWSLRIQKNLVLAKVLADSTIKLASTENQKFLDGNYCAPLLTSESFSEVSQMLDQVKASLQTVTAAFSPVALQLYPEQADALESYVKKISDDCGGDQDLPVGLLNEFEDSRDEVASEGEANGGTRFKLAIKNLAIDDAKNVEKNDPTSCLFSREYHLFLASIYLSEAFERIERTNKEFQLLVKVIGPEIATIENVCSKIHNIFTKSLERLRELLPAGFANQETPSSPQNIDCEKCFEVFNSQSEYLDHMRGHYGPRSEVPTYYSRKDFPMGREYAAFKKTSWLSKNDLKQLLFESYGAT